jgi:hypothetical protein
MQFKSWTTVSGDYRTRRRRVLKERFAQGYRKLARGDASDSWLRWRFYSLAWVIVVSMPNCPGNGTLRFTMENRKDNRHSNFMSGVLDAS